MSKLKSREDAIAGGAMALFGEKYGETVRTISILPSVPAAQPAGGKPPAHTARPQATHASAMAEHQDHYSYELCGGTHLERTSDVGAFIIVSEGSAAAGVRRIEAVTGRGAYALMRHRFDLLQETAQAFKASIEDVPGRVENLQAELAAAKRELTELRTQQALSAFDNQLSQVYQVAGVSVLTLDVPGTDADMLRLLGDRFRARYPRNGAALLASGTTLISVVTEDLVKRGLKAGDLIKAAGGRGGGRPSIAQGSLPDGSDLVEALAKVGPALKSSVQ